VLDAIMGIDKTAVIDLVEYSELAPTRGKNRSIYKTLYPLTIASQDLVVRMHGSTRHLGCACALRCCLVSAIDLMTSVRVTFCRNEPRTIETNNSSSANAVPPSSMPRMCCPGVSSCRAHWFVEFGNAKRNAIVITLSSGRPGEPQANRV
jgi:hypothetical protein